MDREIEEVTVKGKEQEEEGREKRKQVTFIRIPPLKWCCVLFSPFNTFLKANTVLFVINTKLIIVSNFQVLDPGQNSLQNGCDEDGFETCRSF